jgi:hypothetical protein
MGLFSFRNNKRIIKFLPFNLAIAISQADPVTAASQLPTWYKSLRKFILNSDIPYKSHGLADVKLCAPFRDIMNYGYMFVTPCEVEVTRMADGTPEITWNPEYPHKVITVRGDIKKEENQGFGMPIPEGCDSVLFAFTASWGFELPKGYSGLVTQPFNRSDLPFYLTSGIIDADVWSHGGNIPFFVKTSTLGIIPKGTPIAQIIPFKRESWESVIKDVDEMGNNKLVTLRDTVLHGYYVKYVRQQKTFK